MRINGKKIAEEIFEKLRKRVRNLKKKNIIPHLVIILVGEKTASKSYVRQKEIKTKKIGGKVTVYNYPATVSQKEILAYLNDLNHLSNVHGIIVQRPLPPHIDVKAISLATNPKKDIDSFHPQSPYLMPLAQAVLRILEEIYRIKSEIRNPKSETILNNINSNNQSYFSVNEQSEKSRIFENSNLGIASNFDIRYSNFFDWLKSKTIVVIGKGQTGGGPTIEMFKKLGVEPLIVDSKTKNPQVLTKKADIIISTVGKKEIIKPTMIKKGVILISVGLHKGTDAKLHGDYEEEKIKKIASFYTPTPGGVGPVNVAYILRNLIKASLKNFTK